MKIALISLVLLLSPISFAGIEEGDSYSQKTTEEFLVWENKLKEININIQTNAYNSAGALLLLFHYFEEATKEITDIRTPKKDQFFWDERLRNPDDLRRDPILKELDRLRILAISHWTATAPGYEAFWTVFTGISEKYSVKGLPGTRNIYREAFYQGYVTNLKEQLTLLDMLKTRGLDLERGSLAYEYQIKTYDELANLSRHGDFQTRALLLEKGLKEQLIPSMAALRWLVGSYSALMYMSPSSVYGNDSVDPLLNETQEKARWLRWIGHRYSAEIERLAVKNNESPSRVLESLFSLNWSRAIWLELSAAGRPRNFATMTKALADTRYTAMAFGRQCGTLFSF